MHRESVKTFIRHRAQLNAVLVCMIIIDNGLEPAPFPATTETDDYEALVKLMNTPEIYSIFKQYAPSAREFVNNSDMINNLNCFIEFFQRKEVQAGLLRSMSGFRGMNSILGGISLGGSSLQARFCSQLNSIIDGFEIYKTSGKLPEPEVNSDLETSAFGMFPRRQF